MTSCPGAILKHRTLSHWRRYTAANADAPHFFYVIIFNTQRKTNSTKGAELATKQTKQQQQKNAVENSPNVEQRMRHALCMRVRRHLRGRSNEIYRKRE